MHLRLGGHLRWYDPQKRSRLEIPLTGSTRLISLLQQLQIPPAEIAIVTVNRKMVALEDAQVSDRDQVELFPPVGGG